MIHIGNLIPQKDVGEIQSSIIYHSTSFIGQFNVQVDMFTLGHKWKHLGYHFSECSPTSFMYSYIYIYIYIYILLSFYRLVIRINIKNFPFFILILLSPFCRQSKRVFGNQNHTIHTRTTVYDAFVISTI